MTLINQHKSEKSDNVVNVATRDEAAAKSGEEALMDALDSKYDALRDKLLAEALIAQVRYFEPLLWIYSLYLITFFEHIV